MCNLDLVVWLRVLHIKLKHVYCLFWPLGCDLFVAHAPFTISQPTEKRASGASDSWPTKGPTGPGDGPEGAPR